MKWDNVLFQGIAKLVDIYLISLLWIICCIPIITAGAATSAMYYTVRKSVNGSRGYLWRNYWDQFKDGLLDSLKIGLIFELIFLLLASDMYLTRGFLAAGSKFGYLFFFFGILLIVAILWFMWTFNYRARFSQTWKGSMKNGIILFFVHLPQTLIMLVVLAFQVVLTFLVCYYLTLVPLLPFIPASTCVVLDKVLEPIFRKYMTDEEIKREQEIDMENKRD